MPTTIDFYFDFSSPYGYLAAQKIDALAARHGRAVNWHPILLGAVFKITGGRPLPELPLKGDYARRDFVRSAKFHGIAFRIPSVFPISTVSPVRAFYWLQGRDPQQAVALATALYRAYFVDDIDISRIENVARVAQALGIQADELSAALGDPAVKDKTRTEVEAAIAAGVFGSPYVIVDGEPFWGVDRLDQVDRWLATGGW